MLYYNTARVKQYFSWFSAILQLVIYYINIVIEILLQLLLFYFTFGVILYYIWIYIILQLICYSITFGDILYYNWCYNNIKFALYYVIVCVNYNIPILYHVDISRSKAYVMHVALIKKCSSTIWFIKVKCWIQGCLS